MAAIIETIARSHYGDNPAPTQLTHYARTIHHPSISIHDPSHSMSGSVLLVNSSMAYVTVPLRSGGAQDVIVQLAMTGASGIPACSLAATCVRSLHLHLVTCAVNSPPITTSRISSQLRELPLFELPTWEPSGYVRKNNHSFALLARRNFANMQTHNP